MADIKITLEKRDARWLMFFMGQLSGTYSPHDETKQESLKRISEAAAIAIDEDASND